MWDHELFRCLLVKSQKTYQGVFEILLPCMIIACIKIRGEIQQPSSKMCHSLYSGCFISKYWSARESYPNISTCYEYECALHVKHSTLV